MVTATYKGPIEKLKGQRALIRVVGDKVFAQFNDRGLSVDPSLVQSITDRVIHRDGQLMLGFGWHTFKSEEWIV